MENIEHIIRQPEVRRHQTPLLFQHGAWHGAWCWKQWMDYFPSLGYEVHAFSLPGHGSSSTNKGHVNLYSVRDYVDILASQVEALSPTPVVVGHSMGGSLLQKYLEDHHLPGAVLLASLPARGMLMAGLRWLVRHPGAMLKGMLTLNLYHWVGTPTLAHALFLNVDTKVDVREFHRQLVPETARGIQLIFPLTKLDPIKTPVMVIAGERDVLFTVAEEQATARKYQAECVIVKDQAHNLMMESAWQQVADIIDDWITYKLALP